MACLPNDLTLLVGGKTSAAWPLPPGALPAEQLEDTTTLFRSFRCVLSAISIFGRLVCGNPLHLRWYEFCFM